MAVDRGLTRGEMSLDWWRLDVDSEAPAQDYLALRIGGRKGTEGKREKLFSPPVERKIGGAGRQESEKVTLLLILCVLFLLANHGSWGT